MANSKTSTATKPKLTLRPKTIRLRIGKTVQVVKYEPVDVSIEYEYAVQEDDHLPEVTRALYEIVSRQVEKDMDAELSKWRAILERKNEDDDEE